MNKRITQILVAVILTISTLSSTAQAFSMSDVLALITGTNVSANEDASSSTSLGLSSMIATSSPSSKNATAVTSRTYTVQVSGYNSEVGQTDDSPFITANGTHVRDGIVAANIIDSNGRNVPFNTIIKFKNCGGISEDKIFIVTDRLNKRYTNNVDIWFAKHSDAIQFGRRTCQIEVIK